MVERGRAISWDRRHDALVFGAIAVPVRVHWSFVLPIILPFVQQWPERPMLALAHTAILALILFVAVLLHELAHLRVGQREGVKAELIELDLFGGRVHFRQAPDFPARWVRILLAGPLANLCLGGVFLVATVLWSVCLGKTSDQQFPSILPLPIELFEWTLRLGVIVNLVIGVLNLLPAFPLDGGYIARNLLKSRMGSARAARFVGGCGVVLSGLRFIVMFIAATFGALIWLPPPFRANWIVLRGRARRADPASR